MSKDIKEIINNVNNYLTLKKECMDRKLESLYDVITIFRGEVQELEDVCYNIEIKIVVPESDNNCKEVVGFYEENLVNELADVLLTASRLIYEFNLQEALSEMIEYKYERQVGRELNRFKNVKNELLK